MVDYPHIMKPKYPKTLIRLPNPMKILRKTRNLPQSQLTEQQVEVETRTLAKLNLISIAQQETIFMDLQATSLRRCLNCQTIRFIQGQRRIFVHECSPTILIF